MRETVLHMWRVIPQLVIGVQVAASVHDFVVYPARSARTSTAKLIYTQPRQNLVVGPWIIVRPVVELLVDPRDQRNRRVAESVGDRLRFGTLQYVVT